jgi:bisphosphoglycerate-dependent phosphoglycerate mutase
MNETLQIYYLARYGETAWTITGQHTGRTDQPLTERGEGNAQRLGERLSGLTFAKVFTSPLVLSNNPRKLVAIEGYGLTVTEWLPLEIPASASTLRYLRTKRNKLGHALAGL